MTNSINSLLLTVMYNSDAFIAINSEGVYQHRYDVVDVDLIKNSAVILNHCEFSKLDQGASLEMLDKFAKKINPDNLNNEVEALIVKYLDLSCINDSLIQYVQ